MKRAFTSPGLLLLMCGLAIGQPAPTTPAFEAADVHVSPAGSTPGGGFLPGGRIEFRAMTLLRLIVQAYSVRPDAVVSTTSWLDTDRFDVVAKASTAAAQPALRTMLQGLLTERFGLSIQRAEKPQPVNALVPGKNGPPKESSAGEPDCKAGNEENIRIFACQNMTVAALVEALPRVAPAYFDIPMVDRTGLKGAYDFKLQYLPRGQLPPGTEGNSLSLFTSIEKQLGVKVERQTAPVQVLIVEHANRTPADNPPGTIEKLGPPPTEFEVAEVKRSRPDEKENFTMNNGRIDARALTLKDAITFAYNVEDDWVRGGEKWLETDHFDIMAKTAPTASEDTLRRMLVSLLEERFKLKVHKEPQPVPVYALTAGKPKLKEADPSSLSTCKQGAADGSRFYTCQNTTMAQLAEKIRNVAGTQGYLDHPVVDFTGLKGAYDFTLTWVLQIRLQGKGPNPGDGGGGGGGAVPVATDRPVGLTLFEAVDRQLGLKLAVQKHPMPVVVIDHIQRNPTDN